MFKFFKRSGKEEKTVKTEIQKLKEQLALDWDCWAISAKNLGKTIDYLQKLREREQIISNAVKRRENLDDKENSRTLPLLKEALENIRHDADDCEIEVAQSFASERFNYKRVNELRTKLDELNRSIAQKN